MNRWFGRVGAAAVAASTFGLFVPMTAAHAAPNLRALHLVAANSTSPAQAGYAAGAAPTSRVSDRFTVPSVTCSGTTLQVMGMGSVIENTTGKGSGAAVGVICPANSTTPQYVAASLLDGALSYSSNWAPAPGDRIVAAVTETATSLKTNLFDITQGKSYVKFGSGATNAAAFWGIEAFSLSPPTPLPIPTFNTVTFTNAAQNGLAVGAQGNQAFDLQESTVVDVHTGPLNSSGNAFTEHFRATS